MLISVALPVPLYKEFHYLPMYAVQPSTTHLPKIGSRVRVPFGRQTLTGIVSAHVQHADCDIAIDKLKAIKQIIDDVPIIDTILFDFARWLARYYHYPLGEVLSVMLPSYVGQGKSISNQLKHWRLTKEADINSLGKNAHKQREQFNIIAQQSTEANGATEQTLKNQHVTPAYLKILADKGLIESFYQSLAKPTLATLAQPALTLNEEQHKAVESIIHQDADKENRYQGFLLNGVTGSGKTEVYLQVMQSVLAADKQVLLLVPEIGLTPQVKARFSERFNANILLLHSGVNNSDRLQGWQDCQQGQAQIIIGTRSALLYSFKKLGLIIVDEAHDSSYKQQDSLRYHASNVALYRGWQLQIPVVLGTATPTLEQLQLVKTGKLSELLLNNRAGDAKPPIFNIVDARMNGDAPTADTVYAHGYDLAGNIIQQNTGLTTTVIKEIHQRLEAGEQVLVFLNRRGYSPILLCSACGWQADCPHCDAHLTVHRASNYHHNQKNNQTNHHNYLKCHHCGWQARLPSHCPDCQSLNLDAVGIGTTRLTDNLQAIFANPQTSKTPYPIIQIDRDTTRKKGSWQNIYQNIMQGKPCILVGTQMIAKGHHFPKVTLVVMPDADRGFLSANFSSPEQTAQLIMQVAGRAGRSERAGTVLIQSVQPDNPLLVDLVRDGYQHFAERLLKERQTMGLPPFVHACLIRCEGKELTKVHNSLQQALNILPQYNQGDDQTKQAFNKKLAVSGVIDAPMTRKGGYYRAQILLLAQQRNQLHPVIRIWWQHVLSLPSSRGLRLTLDIDPIEW